jgi:hypothetical protein
MELLVHSCPLVAWGYVADTVTGTTHSLTNALGDVPIFYQSRADDTAIAGSYKYAVFGFDVSGLATGSGIQSVTFQCGVTEGQLGEFETSVLLQFRGVQGDELPSTFLTDGRMVADMPIQGPGAAAAAIVARDVGTILALDSELLSDSGSYLYVIATGAVYGRGGGAIASDPSEFSVEFSSFANLQVTYAPPTTVALAALPMWGDVPWSPVATLPTPVVVSLDALDMVGDNAWYATGSRPLPPVVYPETLTLASWQTLLYGSRPDFHTVSLDMLRVCGRIFDCPGKRVVDMAWDALVDQMKWPVVPLSCLTLRSEFRDSTNMVTL